MAASGGAELPRRGFLGAGVADSAAGVEVTRVVDGSTAAAIGLATGDRIVSLQGRAVASSEAFVEGVRGHAVGESLSVRVARGGEELVLEGAVGPLPEESFPDSVVAYGSARTPEGYRLRTILSYPDGAALPLPLVIYIQGVGCNSVDLPFAAPEHPTRWLVSQLMVRGYAVLRADKPGVGDSEGPACGEIGFHEELSAFRALIPAIASHPVVQRERITLFGHSMGGVMAPMIAGDSPEVSAVVVYGAILKSWFEYLVENYRRQLPRIDAPRLEREAAMRDYVHFMHEMVVAGREPEAIFEEYPAMRGRIEGLADGRFVGRSPRFFQELQQISIPEVWSRVRAPVLAVHGELDFVAARDDHLGMVEIARELSGARANFVSLPGLDHGFTYHASLADAYRGAGTGLPSAAVADAVDRWLEGELPGPAGSRP